MGRLCDIEDRNFENQFGPKILKVRFHKIILFPIIYLGHKFLVFIWFSPIVFGLQLGIFVYTVHVDHLQKKTDYYKIPQK